MMMSQNFNRRHSPNRRDTRVPARADVMGAILNATIINVSFDGMRLELSVDLTPGTPITIEVLNQRIPAIVHWCQDKTVGVHLLERLPGQTLIALENAADDLADFR